MHYHAHQTVPFTVFQLSSFSVRPQKKSFIANKGPNYMPVEVYMHVKGCLGAEQSWIG